ncbi:MAG: CPBP family intramembrane metalloprotease [bacterium]|nr:CPBP family intramembrane metalloprotease [bacterium]
MSLTQTVANNKLIFYVFLNYLISWCFLYPCYQAILNAEEGTFPVLALIGIPGGFGPSITAIIIVGFTDGKQAVYELLRKFRSFKVHFKWYLIILILPSSLYLISVFSSTLFGLELGQIELKESLKMIPLYLLVALPFGPLMEELGWRGFMLPELLKKYNIYTSSLILGLVWAFWHTASFTFPGAAIPSVFEVSALTIGLYVLNITAQTFIFSFIFLRTNGSLIIAILLHASFNASTNIILTAFPEVSENVEQRLIIYGVNIILTLIIASGLLMVRHGKSDINTQ